MGILPHRSSVETSHMANKGLLTTTTTTIMTHAYSDRGRVSPYAYVCMICYSYLCVSVYINMNDDEESMLPPAGPKVEESPLRLLYSKYITQTHYAK